ncbi:uncharacterized protein VTP21DRAFT_4051 [Calcarisporiella thermophila]|uniref:uncharacterized protein n=1 Tax=Calcarisporiella thermophila TaxID=911321 RepID=UPI003743721A
MSSFCAEVTGERSRAGWQALTSIGKLAHSPLPPFENSATLLRQAAMKTEIMNANREGSHHTAILSQILICLKCAEITKGTGAHKLSSFFVLAALAAVAVAQKPVVVKNCGRSGDIFKFESASITPNPPREGEEVTLKTKGTLSEQVEVGATIEVEIKYGPIVVKRLKNDFCEELKKANKTCPLAKGPQELIVSTQLPNDIPSGTYTLTGKIATKDKRPIACLTGTAEF